MRISRNHRNHRSLPKRSFSSTWLTASRLPGACWARRINSSCAIKHSGERSSPTLYLAGPGFSGRSIQSPEEAIQKVQQQKHEGWDLLKIHPGLTRAAYDAMATTAQQVGMRFVGHMPAEVGLLHALEMGQETIAMWMGTSSICRPAMAWWMRRNWRTWCGAPLRQAPGLCLRWPCGRFYSGPVTWRRSSVMRKSNTCHRNRSSMEKRVPQPPERAAVQPAAG